MDSALILVVSNTKDTHVDLVTDRLVADGYTAVRFDTDRVGRECNILFTDDGTIADSRIIVGEFDFSAADVRSVWWRRPEAIGVLGEGRDRDASLFAAHEWTSAVHGVLRTVPGLWVSHPEALRLANHKILQFRAAHAVGFATPATCISADPVVVRAFCEQHGYRVVAKLVSAGPPRVEPPDLQYMVYTTPVTAADLANDDALMAAPAIYQEYVEKDHELRVTVVGDSVFACAIESQATPRTRIDWRHYDLDRTPHRAVDMEPQLRSACVQLVRRLDLAFGAIDLIVTPDGEVVFLEINPNGQWAWIEELTGLPIARALADLLAQGARSDGCRP